MINPGEAKQRIVTPAARRTWWPLAQCLDCTWHRRTTGRAAKAGWGHAEATGHRVEIQRYDVKTLEVRVR